VLEWCLRADATAAPTCTGDCEGPGSVTVEEIITLVNIALGTSQPVSLCEWRSEAEAGLDVALLLQAWTMP
jgi:hypothetical protein